MGGWRKRNQSTTRPDHGGRGKGSQHLIYSLKSCIVFRVFLIKLVLKQMTPQRSKNCIIRIHHGQKVQCKQGPFQNKPPASTCIVAINNRVLQDQGGEVREQLWTFHYQLTLKSTHLFIPLLLLPFPLFGTQTEGNALSVLTPSRSCQSKCQTTHVTN